MDEGELRRRYPEIPWDQPVRIRVISNPPDRWVCRYCIALYGLKAELIDATLFAYESREDALDHIDDLHHD